MPRNIVKERTVTVPQAKKILESVGEEWLDQFQRRSLDYASKFSKIDAEAAKELTSYLMKEFGLEEEEATQVVNCMPESIEELRVFLAGGRRIVETSKLEGILAILNKYRKME